MSKTITFTGKMEELDFKKLFYYQTGYKLFYIIPIYFIIFLALIYILNNFKEFNFSMMQITLFSAVSSILFVLIYIILLYNRLRKEFLKDLPKIKEQIYNVEDDRISIIVEQRKTDILYKDIKKIKITKEFYILYHKAKIMIAIPKRFIDKDMIIEIDEKLKKIGL